MDFFLLKTATTYSELISRALGIVVGFLTFLFLTDSSIWCLFAFIRLPHIAVKDHHSIFLELNGWTVGRSLSGISLLFGKGRGTSKKQSLILTTHPIRLLRRVRVFVAQNFLELEWLCLYFAIGDSCLIEFSRVGRFCTRPVSGIEECVERYLTCTGSS
jgi:hypothetical protein